MGAGVGGSPEGPGGRAWGGAWRPRGRPRAADDRRPAEADQSRAGGGRRRGKASGPATGSRQPVTPHSPRHATGGSTPARPAAGGGRKAVVAGATGEGAWGGGVGARGAPPPPPPRTQPRGTWRGGGPGGKRDAPHTQPGRRRRHRVAGGAGGAPAPGAGEEWRARRGGGPAGAGRGGAGREGSSGEPPFPNPNPPPKLCTPPPPQQTLLAQLLTPKHHRGRPPTVDPTTRGGAPSRRGSLPLPPFFPSHPAPHGWRRGSRAGRGEATDTALGTDHVNDPSAGSPTETLLRLLLPLDSQVRPSSQRSARAVGRPRRGRSEGLTKPSNR